MIKTAECVSPMHPDKMCDRISDTLLDLYLQGDPNSRVAIETCGGNGKVFITGEVTSNTEVSDDDIKTIVHNISGVEDVTIHLNSQSPEISQGVDTGGAGDQGIMIGYACNENDQYLPQEYFLSRELNKFIYGKFPYDGKTQVTMNGNSLRVVCSFQNAPSDRLQQLVLQYFEDYPQYHIEALHCNPAGDWDIGGFTADAGVTGRKLAVDNYGPRVPIGGGAFVYLTVIPFLDFEAGVSLTGSEYNYVFNGEDSPSMGIAKLGWYLSAQRPVFKFPTIRMYAGAGING